MLAGVLTWLLVLVVILLVLVDYAAMRVSGRCSRDEERQQAAARLKRSESR